MFARRSEMTRVGSLALKFRSRINTKPSELSNRYNGSTEYTLYLAIVHDLAGPLHEHSRSGQRYTPDMKNSLY